MKKVSLTDMSVTIVCFKKPKKLFETLETSLGYEVLQNDDGIYYIINSGLPPEKSLAIQVIVSSELPDSEALLKDLNRNIGHNGAKRFMELYEKDDEQMGHLFIWLKTVLCENLEFLLKEGYVKNYDEMITKMAIASGVSKTFEQKGRQEGWQAGKQEGWQEGSRNIIEFLESGHSIEDAKKAFALH